MRRRERRAAGRTAAAGAATEEVGAKKAAENAAAEVAAQKAAAKEAVSAAEEAAAAKKTDACAAEQAATAVADPAEKATAKKDYAKEAAAKKTCAEEVPAVIVSGKDTVVEKAIAAEKVRIGSTEKVEESASTSTGNVSSCSPTTSVVAVPVSTCWTCEDEMTMSHQCVTSSSSCLPPSRKPTLEVLSPVAARLRPDPSAPYIIKGKIRHLDGSPIVTPRPQK